MKKTISFTLIAIVFFSSAGWGQALSQSENRPILKTTDETGCYLTDGKFTGPTIVLAAGLYKEPGFPEERALKIIDVALSSGCSIEYPDEIGSTPLVASIIYNEPHLAEILLEKGADPYLKISSPKKYIDGLNAFEIADFLRKKLKSQDREKLHSVLSYYK